MMKSLLLAIILALTLLSVAAADEPLRIVNIRVGQGDATLIQGPTSDDSQRINVLFDAGDIPDLDGGNILRAVFNRYDVEELDFMIVSHDDADHIGGITAGGVHGKSFLLGFDESPGCPGDDDGDGIEDWEEEFIEPDQAVLPERNGSIERSPEQVERGGQTA